jgi:hypothetical protein
MQRLFALMQGFGNKLLRMTPAFKKVRYRSIVTKWKALKSNEKLLALVILANTGKTGWANMSLGEIQKDSGGMHYQTIHNGIARLEELGVLQIAPSDQKRHTLYRLHESDKVREPS